METSSDLITLRPYQVEACTKMVAWGNACLFDDAGIGKTPTTVSVVKTLNKYPVLVACPKIAINVWERMIPRLIPDANVHCFYGTPDQRETQWGKFLLDSFLNSQSPTFLITNFDQIKNLPKKDWNILIIDECHYIKNSNTKRFKEIKSLAYKNVFLLSGTPISKGPEDLFAYLNLIDPVRFRFYWPFVKEHCNYRKTQFGTEIRGPKNAAALREMLSSYVIRRTKEEVLPELSFSRESIYCDLTPEQNRGYQELVDELLLELDNGDYLMINNPAALTVKLRQFIVCPNAVGKNIDSGPLQTLKEMVGNINKPVAIFSEFRSAFPFIEQSLSEIGYRSWFIQGGMTKSKIDDTVASFNESTDNKRAIVITLGMAEAYSLTSTSYGFIIGPSWSPTPNIQAESRLNRDGQKNHVNFFYILGKGTIDDSVVDHLNDKTTWSRMSVDDLRYALQG